LVEQAPKLIDFLGEESLQHLKTVQAILDANGVAWKLNPRLVRGMDYYNLTVFEFVTTELGAQGTICGGGRYDYLIEMIGGKPAPAVGWALGVERVLELIKSQGKVAPAAVPDVYAVLADASVLPAASRCIESLRRFGVKVQMHTAGAQGWGSFKSQFKKADASGAAYALVFGADEVAANEVTVKPLRDATQTQTRQSLTDVSAWARNIQSDIDK
jgi:histidyl-tRNA synthetase